MSKYMPAKFQVRKHDVYFGKWIIARKEEFEESVSELISDKLFDKRAEYLQAGGEIGILEVLRFAKENCSEPKFKEFADKFNYDKLNEKYPINPLLERKDGKATP